MSKLYVVYWKDEDGPEKTTFKSTQIMNEWIRERSDRAQKSQGREKFEVSDIWVYPEKEII